MKMFVQINLKHREGTSPKALLFGPNDLDEACEGKSKDEKEEIVMNALSNAINNATRLGGWCIGAQFDLPNKKVMFYPMDAIESVSFINE